MLKFIYLYVEHVYQHALAHIYDSLAHRFVQCVKMYCF